MVCDVCGLLSPTEKAEAGPADQLVERSPVEDANAAEGRPWACALAMPPLGDKEVTLHRGKTWCTNTRRCDTGLHHSKTCLECSSLYRDINPDLLEHVSRTPNASRERERERSEVPEPRCLESRFCSTSINHATTIRRAHQGQHCNWHSNYHGFRHHCLSVSKERE